MITTRRVLAAGLLVLAAALVVTLLQSAPRRSGTDMTPNPFFVTGLAKGGEVCQGGETLPADTAGVVVTIETYGKPGPGLGVTVSAAGGRVLTGGGLPGGWRQGAVRIPLARVATTTPGVTVCLRDLGPGPGKVALAGVSPDASGALRTDGQPVFAHLRIDYVRPGNESWFALLPAIFHRFSLGKGDLVRHWAGPAAIVLMLLAIALAAATLERLPRAAWLCAAVALANGLAWSVIVPPFEVPDENAHYAYVQQVAERGTVPHVVHPEGELSPAEDAILSATGFFAIIGQPYNPAPMTALQQEAIDEVADRGLSAKGSGNALTATANPPLYYVLEAVPYKLTPGGRVLDRLAMMRVLSALMGAATVLLIFLFLRELLPGQRLAWSAGALAVAFQPLFGFMSGGVNNDNLLYLCAAGVLWSLARAFRRGLSPATGAALGAFLGLGLVAKLTLIGFIPGVALALGLLLWRERTGDGPRRRETLRGAAVTVAVAAVPVVVYVALNHLVWHRGAIPGGVGSVSGVATGRTFNIREEVSHVWQLFLPPLFWMDHQFTYDPLWITWFKGFIGRFGWLDYGFPAWVYRLALGCLLVVGALAVGELVRRREALWRRLGELSVYALVVVGLAVEIGVQSYRFLVITGGQFEQARYLLSLLGLYAAVVALAVRFGGRRFGGALAVGLVVLAIAHDLFAQLLTISRYYS